MKKRKRPALALVSLSIIILTAFPAIHVADTATLNHNGALTPSPSENYVSTASPSGSSTILAQKTWGGPSQDGGRGVAVDSSGNIYVTGVTDSFGPGSPSHGALTLLKYSSDGGLIWQRIWSGRGNGSDVGEAVAVDSSGNIYVTGSTSSFGAGGVLLLKFDPSGALTWQRTWGASLADYGNDVALDSSGDIYVTGATTTSGLGGGSVFLLKFDSSGNLLWQEIWPGSGGSAWDFGNGVAVDSSGNIYVTGDTNFGSDGRFHVLLLKFDSSGALTWQRTWEGSAEDDGFGVAVDGSSNVYVTGSTNFGAGSLDALLLKFDSSGDLIWQKTWGGPSQDGGRGVAVDSFGNIFVTGQTGSFGAGGWDVFLLKFVSSGDLMWQRTWGGSGADVGNGVAVDPAGSAVIAGDVGEAPPYALGTIGNSTLGIPNFTLGMPALTIGTASGIVKTPLGTISSPAGIQSYTGSGSDEFILKYGVPLDVSLSLDPRIVSSTSTVNLQVHVSNGTYPISNALTQLTSDGGGSFNPQSGSTNSTGYFNTIFTAPTVSQQINVNITAAASKIGCCEGVDHNHVAVLPPPDFSLNVAPRMTLQQGSSVSLMIGLTSLYGFTGTATLSTPNLPTGITTSFTYPAVSSSQPSTVSIKAASYVAVGVYTVHVSGTSGPQTHSADVIVTVTAAAAVLFGLDPATFYGAVGGLVALIAIVGAAVAFSRRKRGSIPIMVQSG